jgi:molybdopterin-guanine dinucleotide biosynthesis protein A
LPFKPKFINFIKLMKAFDDIACAVLAGGQSRRFGTQKTQASLGKKTLLEIAIDLAHQLTDSIVIIGDTESSRILNHITVHADIMPGNGPLGGIHSALKFARKPYAAMLPCDMPRMIPDVYHILASRRIEDRPVVAFSHTGLEPLVSIWPRTAAGAVERRLKSGRTSPIEALYELDCVEVRLPKELIPYDPNIFLNINTRHDLESALKPSTSMDDHEI